MSRPAAFLDRDGTINRRPPPHQYVSQLEDFELLPGAVEGMASLAACGYTLVLASNQRGIARDLVSEDFLRASEAALHEALAADGVEIGGFYYCPHEIEEGCDCRKPQPGMLLRAAAELGLNLESSWMVGDSASDVEAGAAAGCRTAAIGPEAAAAEATVTAGSLREAAELICG